MFTVRDLLNQCRILDVYLVKEKDKLKIPKGKLKECVKYCKGAGNGNTLMDKKRTTQTQVSVHMSAKILASGVSYCRVGSFRIRI